MRDEELYNGHVLLNGPDLHLKGPSPIPVVHFEREKTGEPDSPEGRQILEPPPPEEPHRRQDQAITPAGVRMDVARVSVVLESGAKDQIGPVAQGYEEFLEMSGVLRMIGIHEDQHLRRVRERGKVTNPLQTGGPVPTASFVDDPSTHGGGRLGGSVRGAIVRYDHRVQPVHRHGIQDGRQGSLLVQRRNQNRRG